MARGSKGSVTQSRKTKSASSKPDKEDTKSKSELPKGGKRNGKTPKEAKDLDVKRTTRGKRKSEITDKGDNRDHNVEAVKSTHNNNNIKQSVHSKHDRLVCVKREVIEVDYQKASEKSDVVEFMSSSSDDSDFEPETKKLKLTPKCNSSTKADIPKSKKKKEKEKNVSGCESPGESNISTSNSKRKSNTGRSRGKSENQVAVSRPKVNKGKQGEKSEPQKKSKAKGKSDDAERSGKPDETRKRKIPEKCAPEMPDLSVEKNKKRRKNSKKDSISTEKEPASVVKMEMDNDVKKTDKLIHSNIDQSDVMSVLLHMEGQSMLSNSQDDWSGPSTSGIMVKSDRKGGDSDSIESIDEDDDSEESEWEEVEDDPSQRSPLKSQIPSEPVEVTLDAPQILKKRKKKQFDWKAYIQRQINRFRKELREDIHKVHLMCLLARGMYLNRVCNDTTLHAITMSIIPAEFIKKQRSSCDNGSVERLMKWFKGCFRIVPDVEETEEDMAVKLIARLGTKSVISSLEFVMLFIIILRFLGFHARLVMSHQPLSLKALEPKSGNVDSSKSKVKGNPSAEKKKSKSSKSNSNKSTSGKEEKGKKAQTSKGSSKSAKTSKSDKQSKDDSKGEQMMEVKKKALRKRGVKVKPSNYLEDEESDSSEDDYVPSDESDEEGETGGKKKKRKEKEKKKSVVKKQTSSTSHGDEDDFEEETISFRSPLKKKNSNKKPNKRVLSSDSENGAEESRRGCDQWAEVYLDERWICVDCLHGHMNRPYRLESAASQPVHYVLAYNSDGTLKDVTARYASKWMTDTRKIRVNSDWLEETLDPYRTTNQKLDEKEDNDIKCFVLMLLCNALLKSLNLNGQISQNACKGVHILGYARHLGPMNTNLVSRPMPTNIGAFKSHPLYALTRHLLKFEAIYPESAVPLGYIRGEPIYARECVHELHSRENWIKEGRAVRIGEKPYKMVKSRPKWNKPKENPDALDLEVFGLWQTEEYIPPPAVNGKVPRNDYGNIELFKPSMLPAGTVYLQVQGLNKVAKKLNVDCVPAMVGWDSHCGFSHPVLDGFVVCEEHKDILLAAWDEEQEIQKQKEAEKKEKRALNNWKVLIKGLLIKERLKKRFDLEEKNEDKQEDEEKKPVKGQRANDAELAWPRRQQDAKSKKGKGKKSDNKANHFKVETM